MEAWGDPEGEALHTGTFFGHPLGAAAALASLEVLEEGELLARVPRIGAELAAALRATGLGDVRGEGLLLALETGPAERTLALVQALLRRGYLVLPAGADASVIQLVPPFTITSAQIAGLADALREAAAEVGA